MFKSNYYTPVINEVVLINPKYKLANFFKKVSWHFLGFIWPLKQWFPKFIKHLQDLIVKRYQSGGGVQKIFQNIRRTMEHVMEKTRPQWHYEEPGACQKLTKGQEESHQGVDQEIHSYQQKKTVWVDKQNSKNFNITVVN